MHRLSKYSRRFKNPIIQFGLVLITISAAYIIPGVTEFGKDGHKVLSWVLVGVGCLFALGGLAAILIGLFCREVEETPGIKESCKKATEIWMLLYTGGKHQKYLCDRNYSYKFKKILLLDFNENKDAFKHILDRSGSDEDELIPQIKTTTKLAVENNTEVRWYSRERNYTIVIYDPNATDDSKSWLVFQYFDPFQSVEDRYLSPPIRKSVDKAQYQYYFDEFMRLWNNKEDNNTTRVPSPSEYESFK